MLRGSARTCNAVAGGADHSVLLLLAGDPEGDLYHQRGGIETLRHPFRNAKSFESVPLRGILSIVRRSESKVVMDHVKAIKHHCLPL